MQKVRIPEQLKKHIKKVTFKISSVHTYQKKLKSNSVNVRSSGTGLFALYQKFQEFKNFKNFSGVQEPAYLHYLREF